MITWLDVTTGDIMANWETSCPGVFNLEERVFRKPTPDDLIPGFYGALLARIEAPPSVISPPDAAPINLGLWLATGEPTVLSESGSIGPYSVSVDAAVVETTFDMGNGDVVTCEGSGVEIVDPDVVEEGPCGYTYREALAEGASIRITSSWDVSYATSLGGGTLPGITTDSVIPYETYEIQTVGVG